MHLIDLCLTSGQISLDDPLLWNIAQFVSYGLLLNLFFGWLQTDNWLLRYGYFKVLGAKAKFTLCLHALW